MVKINNYLIIVFIAIIIGILFFVNFFSIKYNINNTNNTNGIKNKTEDLHKKIILYENDTMKELDNQISFTLLENEFNTITNHIDTFMKMFSSQQNISTIKKNKAVEIIFNETKKIEIVFSNNSKIVEYNKILIPLEDNSFGIKNAVFLATPDHPDYVGGVIYITSRDISIIKDLIEKY